MRRTASRRSPEIVPRTESQGCDRLGGATCVDPPPVPAVSEHEDQFPMRLNENVRRALRAGEPNFGALIARRRL